MWDQALAFAILFALIVLFVWDRFRYDLVALLGLLAGIAAGVVPVEEAFTGFGDEIVIIIASALVVSAAIARSGLIESLVRPLAPFTRTTSGQVAVLGGIVAALSAFIKNIGALAMFLPVALQLTRRNDTSPSCLLMPLSFSALLGGLMTLVGTSPNVIVSRMRGDLLGEPFRMFDFLPVGLGVAAAGLVFLSLGYRLLPARGDRGRAEWLFEIRDYTTEARIPPGSPIINRTVYDLETIGEADVTVTGIIREGDRFYTPHGHWWLFADDILFLEGDPHALKRIIDDAGLELVPAKEIPAERPLPQESLGVYEAVVVEGSPLIGRAVGELQLRERHLVNLLAMSRRGQRVTARMRHTRLQAGDVVVLQGAQETMPDTLAALGLLPLAERNLQLGRRRSALVPAAILAAAVALVATQLVPVAVAFFGAAIGMVLARALTLREAYDAIDWPILILIGALIPVSEAVQATGGTELIAGWLSAGAARLPAAGAVALTIAVAMAVTPFLNNAATVLVMAPIAAGLAANLGLSPDPFLMAVAIGAACDFLTPIGHQCNTLVMGPGGYRFGDYWRLGLPLSVIVMVVATVLILVFWPLR
jgi:di/tricarboxylate transporter